MIWSENMRLGKHRGGSMDKQKKNEFGARLQKMIKAIQGFWSSFLNRWEANNF